MMSRRCHYFQQRRRRRRHCRDISHRLSSQICRSCIVIIDLLTASYILHYG